MIIIINKLQIYGKRFCEKRVRGSILCNEKPGGGFALPGLRYVPFSLSPAGEGIKPHLSHKFDPLTLFSQKRLP